MNALETSTPVLQVQTAEILLDFMNAVSFKMGRADQVGLRFT